ncbi:MAG TPA: sugar ABC transporter ATP-binding protein [Phycisphaerales bacterium]|nr:sugar ABC transporter ATP-binding protein [Phycisphaerales bacterium]HCD33822.1 sugar ABC transporter ATP-binding protein [Phycisphaerales bacterium]
MSMPPQWIPRQAQVTIDDQVHDVSKVQVIDEQTCKVFLKDSPGQTVVVDRQQVTKKIAPQWQNFSQAVDSMQQFPRYLTNTLILCILTVIGTVSSSALAAYGFSRIEWFGRDKVFLLVLATMMIPFPVVMVPLYSLFKSLGWIGTLKPLWVGSFCAGAFNVFLLRQFFIGIPTQISESARLDGASEFRIFWQIILPLAKPALVVVALFQFMGTWNDFLGPLIYLTDQEDFTLALGLQFFQSQSGGTQWHYLMAASLLVVLPIIFVFFCSQKSFIEGISMTGVKG